MGHALEQIHRVLTPGGYVADIRPNRPAQFRNRRAGRAQVSCLADGWMAGAGVFQEQMSHYRAADRAVEQALRRRLFTLQTSMTFGHRYYFRSLAVLDHYLATQWTAASMGVGLRRTLHALLRSHPRARIRVETSVRLNVLKAVTLSSSPLRRRC